MTIKTQTIVAVTALAAALLSGAAESEQSPYGVCAHLAREEFKEHQSSMRLMQQAGIRWARADFSWSTVQPSEDIWDFKRFDAILASAPQHGIQILPILNYNNRFADPAWRHLDKWERYVRALAERYQERIPVWEVWNEQNLQNFWKDPNPENYLPLLKRSYETIKAVNPDLKVAVGGYAGIPFDYIEKLYELGGGRYFDIMNVHPYSHPRPPEENLAERLAQLRELMRKHGDADKPVWITEIGWPTPEVMGADRGLIRAALATLLPKKPIYRAICIRDPAGGSEGWLTADRIAPRLPENCSIQILDFDAVAPTLDNYPIDIVMLPPGENFHLEGVDRLVRYVREGGVVVALDKMPLWYGYTRDADGLWRRSNKSAYHTLRIQPEAWWNNKGVIPEEMEVRYAGPATELPDHPAKIVADRFLQPHNFKEGDRFIPLLQGKTETYTGTAAAIYDFNSDWKGALVVSTLAEGGSHAVDFHGQSQMLPRAQIIARRCGVERIFWYEFQAPEYDPVDKESHFGIVRKDFSEKPAYAAYRTLTEQLPPGSAFIEKEWHRADKSLYYPQWRLPGGSPAGALWAYGAPGIYRVAFSGTPEFRTNSGQPLTPPSSDGSVILSLDGAPLYFRGAEIQRIDRDYQPEQALDAALPHAFERAQRQYAALLKALEGTENVQPRRWQNGRLITVKPTDWTSGFFPAALWYLYEYTGHKRWQEAAVQYTAVQEQVRGFTGNHDIGFMIYCPYGNALRLAESQEGIREILFEAADALCSRYAPRLGMIRSWNSHTFPVIIDNMMNLELLMWAAKNSDNPVYREVALSHADHTDRLHYRPDGGAYHIVDYNPANGKILGYHAGQGASADAPWSRGQSWGLYGFTMMFRETGRRAYRERAVKCAEFLIRHPNLPQDGIPYWDYEASEIPHAPRDAAAAAIMASALLELSSFEGVANAADYRAAAVRQLLALCSPDYLAAPGGNGNFILMHAVGHLPGNIEIDVPLNYADYYFLEALLRYRKLRSGAGL